MKILASIPKKIINFTSVNLEDFNDELKHFGDDYLGGQAIREALRSRMLTNIIPDYKSNVYDTATIDDVYISNLVNIGNDSYKGATISKNLEYLDVLKNSGINTVIDLQGYDKLEKACQEKNLDYFVYKVEDDYWQNPIFHSDDELIKKKTKELSELSLTKADFDKFLEQYKEKIQNERQEFLQGFAKLIKKMNEGHFYISCEFGEYRTPNILALNTMFNPNWSGKKTVLNNNYLSDFFNNMYKNLTEKDKIMLKN